MLNHFINDIEHYLLKVDHNNLVIKFTMACNKVIELKREDERRTIKERKLHKEYERKENKLKAEVADLKYENEKLWQDMRIMKRNKGGKNRSRCKH